MKKFRKLTLISLVALLAVALLAAPTLSWLFTTSEEVVNTFEGGDISVKLDEAKVDENGVAITTEDRVTANDYKFVAGSELDKDPTPTVLKGSVLSYIFICVDNANDDIFSLNIDTRNWLEVASKDGKTLYVYHEKVDAEDEDVTLEPIFTKVKVSEDLTLDDLKALKQTAEKQFIKAQVYAIQAEVIEKDVAIDNAVERFISGATNVNYVDVA